MLDKEFKYFRDNQSDLVKKYQDRYVVIVGEKVVGDYATESEAYEAASKSYQPGTFLIQHCIPGEKAYKQTFHSRVLFS